MASISRAEGLHHSFSSPRGALAILALWSLVMAPGAAGCSGSGKSEPALHRSAATPCPNERAAGIDLVEAPQGCVDNPSASLGCLKDSDCTAGSNGRCTASPGPACQTFCTYDDCRDDSDCESGGACLCRTSSTAPGPNQCAAPGPSCRVDADCGKGDFCSPSLIGTQCICNDESFCPKGPSGCSVNGVEVPCSCSGTCGHGYFCHTSEDKCLDDSDCAPHQTCNFDLAGKRWLCTGCIEP